MPTKSLQSFLSWLASSLAITVLIEHISSYATNPSSHFWYLMFPVMLFPTDSVGIIACDSVCTVHLVGHVVRIDEASLQCFLFWRKFHKLHSKQVSKQSFNG